MGELPAAPCVPQATLVLIDRIAAFEGKRRIKNVPAPPVRKQRSTDYTDEMRKPEERGDNLPHEHGEVGSISSRHGSQLRYLALSLFLSLSQSPFI